VEVGRLRELEAEGIDVGLSSQLTQKLLVGNVGNPAGRALGRFGGVRR